MGTKLYVGNLSTETTEAELQDFFSTYGTVVSVRIKRDSVTGESWGYGFIDMADDATVESILIKVDDDLRLDEHQLNIETMRLPNTFWVEESGDTK